MSSIIQFPDGTTLEFDASLSLARIVHDCEAMCLGYRMRWRPDPKPESAKAIKAIR